MSRLGYIVVTLVCAELFAGLYLAVLLVQPRPMLVWNATASAPIGLYRLSDGAIQRGDLVVLRAPERLAGLMARRRYLPRSVPLLKRIAALGDDKVCRFGDAITINGRTAARALARDSHHRALPAWQGCHRLGADEVFVLNAAPDSFDSRYFGAVPRASVIARAIPLLTRRRPGEALHWRGIGASPATAPDTEAADAAAIGMRQTRRSVSSSSLPFTKG